CSRVAGNRRRQRSKKYRQQKQSGNEDIAQSRAGAGSNPGRALNVAGHRRCSGKRSENSADSVGNQGPSNPRDLAIFDESALLTDSEQRAYIVEQVHKEKNENDLQQAKVQRTPQIKLQPGGGRMRQRQDMRRPCRQAAKDPENSGRDHAYQNGS